MNPPDSWLLTEIPGGDNESLLINLAANQTDFFLISKKYQIMSDTKIIFYARIMPQVADYFTL